MMMLRESVILNGWRESDVTLSEAKSLYHNKRDFWFASSCTADRMGASLNCIPNKKIVIL